MFGGRTEWYLTDPFGKRCVPPKKAPIRSLKIIIFRVQPLISCGTISRSPRRRWMIYAGFWTVRLRQLSNISRQTTIRCCKPLTFGRNRLYWKYEGCYRQTSSSPSEYGKEVTAIVLGLGGYFFLLQTLITRLITLTRRIQNWNNSEYVTIAVSPLPLCQGATKRGVAPCWREGSRPLAVYR